VSLLDDGKLAGVVEARQKGNVVVRVTRTQKKGFKMKSERGLIFPNADLHLDPLTAKDLADLDFVATHADLVGYSFVPSADDITDCRRSFRSVVLIGDALVSSRKSRLLSQ
jgi:pyruvate kinase